MAAALGTGSNANGTNVFTKPTGLANGDVVVIRYGTYSGTSGAPSAPSGFTTVVSGTRPQGGGYMGFGIFRKVITNAAGEPASYTVGRVGTPGWDGGRIDQVTGADTTTPETDSGSNGAGSGSSMTTGAAVDSGANDLLLLLGINNGQSMTNPAGTTQSYELDGGDFEGWSASPGALSGATYTSTLGGSTEWDIAWAVFKAAAGGTSATITGVTATAAAAANAGTIAAQVSTTIAGATATATAAAPAGTVAAVQIAAPAGETATAAAAANAGTIAAQVTDTIAGATATAPASAPAGTIAAVQIAAPAGATATAGADALAGTVNTGVPVTVAGATATAAAAAGAGTGAALQTVTVAGETATSAAQAGSGAILIARTVPGATATAAAAGLASAIAAQVGAQVAGERATATAAGLAAVLATVQIAAVSGAAAAALAAALAGTFVSNVETGGAGFAPQKATVSIRRLPAARAKLVP